MNKIATFLRESGPARFFIPAGLILTIFGIIVLIININNQNYEKVTGTVSKSELIEEAHTDSEGNYVDASYDVYVKYKVGEAEYSGVLSGISEYKKGEKVTIYYNPDNPSQITQTKSIILPIIIIVAGIGALSYGIISSVNATKKYKLLKEQEKGWENGK